jgi:translocation and assembly module TamA
LNKDIPKHVAHNIHNYLGDLPNNHAERLLFIVNARDNITKAIQALGYYRATINLTTLGEDESTAWSLTIDVALNQPTVIESSEIIISGEAQSDEVFKTLIQKQDFKQGEILDHGKYEQFKLSLASLGLKHGYFDARFIDTRIAIHQSYHSAKIYIHYNSGQRFRLGKVNFSDFEINNDLLTQLIPFTYEQPYNVKLLRKLQSQLEQTQYFSNIVIDPKNKQHSEGIIPIDVNIEKGQNHHFDLGLGYATNTRLRVSAGWKTSLLNRYGHKQETKITYSEINPVGLFNYTIPLSHPLNDVSQFELRLEDDVYGDIESKYWSARLGRVKKNERFVSEYYLRYLKEDWQLDSQNYSALYYLPGMTWSKVTRKGDPINPSQGFSQYYNVELSHQEIGSDTSFLRFYAKWKYINSFNANHRFVARAELGFLVPERTDFEEMSPSLRFFAGGDESIRGFSYQSIGSSIPNPQNALDVNEPETLIVGGSRLSVGSVEYQYQFHEKWRAAIFLDGGSVYKKDKFKAVYSVGPGIHYMSPIGAIRLYLGYSLSKDNPSWRIHFNLGAEL